MTGMVSLSVQTDLNSGSAGMGCSPWPGSGIEPGTQLIERIEVGRV